MMILRATRIKPDFFEIVQETPKGKQFWYYDMDKRLSSTTGEKDEIPTHEMTNDCYNSLKKRLNLG